MNQKSPPPTIIRLSLILLAVSLASTSCISLKRYSTIVDTKVRTIAMEDMNQNSNIRFSEPKPVDGAQQVKTIKKRNLFIPAILFWYWESSYKTEFEPGFVANLFNSRLLAQADELGIRKALGDKNLEIKLENAPDGFDFSRKGMALFLLVAYTTSSTETIQPKPTSPAVQFSLKSGTSVLKKGTIMVSNPLTKPQMNSIQKSSRFTSEYIDSYLASLDAMAKETVLKLRSELATDLNLPPLQEAKGNGGF